MINEKDEQYMRRCFDLARRSFRISNFNPCVGAVLVYNNRIIGEGYYQNYGGAHAEVRCVESVQASDRQYIQQSTLYVSLEPCSFHGKTPPCANFIVRHNIPEVVVSVIDPNPKIKGRGIAILQEHGIKVKQGVLEKEGMDLIRKFKVNTIEQRPYIAMKWAQSKDYFAGRLDESVWISNPYTKYKAHELRTQYEAILVGSNTVQLDNPSLNNRIYPDHTEAQPIKIVIDRTAKIDERSKLFHTGSPVHIFTSNTSYKNPNGELCHIHIIDQELWSWDLIMSKLFDLKISSVLIEGGPTIQKSLIKHCLWDEIHLLSSNQILKQGIHAPNARGNVVLQQEILDNKYQKIYPR